MLVGFGMLAAGPDAAAHDVLDEALGELAHVLHHDRGLDPGTARRVHERGRSPCGEAGHEAHEALGVRPAADRRGVRNES